MDIEGLKQTFKLNAKLGRLYRGKNLVWGTPKFDGGPLVVTYKGKQVPYARVCYALHHGYLPRQVRHRNGQTQDNRIENLYDPVRVQAEQENGGVMPHAGKYVGVYLTHCQYSGKFRGYRGAFYFQGKRHYTPVVETAEMARDLRMLLAAQVEWEAQQKENTQ